MVSIHLKPVSISSLTYFNRVRKEILKAMKLVQGIECVSHSTSLVLMSGILTFWKEQRELFYIVREKIE